MCKRVRKSLKTKGIGYWAYVIEIPKGRGPYTPRRDRKSAEMIDKRRVVRRPSRKRVRNPLKRKDLNAKKAGMERAQGEKAGIGE
jgi:hypothetical protein